MIKHPVISVQIDKEQIPDLYFPDKEVLRSTEEINKRREDAERGSFLGNGYNSKVFIYFVDIEGNKNVETTIWEVTETLVVLKNNIRIPLHRIIGVRVKSEDLKYPNI